MPSYYEMLKVQPTATVAEIQAVCEQQYEQWRRLVTHHDPNVVNQANQALQVLQQIQSTLVDPAKRAAYDAGIGLGNVAGLVDLNAFPSTKSTPPPADSRTRPPSSQPTVEASLWRCPNPKCNKTNPEHTKFCFNCGTQLVRACPECGELSSLVATGLCGNCGYQYDVAQNRQLLVKKAKELASERALLTNQLQEINNRKSNSGIWILLGIMGLLSAILFIGSGSGQSLAYCGLPGMIALIAGFAASNSFSTRKQADLQHVTQQLDDKLKQARAVEQEYKQLELRKTIAS